jgi:hypothetical protein
MSTVFLSNVGLQQNSFERYTTRVKSMAEAAQSLSIGRGTSSSSPQQRHMVAGSRVSLCTHTNTHTHNRYEHTRTPHTGIHCACVCACGRVCSVSNLLKSTFLFIAVMFNTMRRGSRFVESQASPSSSAPIHIRFDQRKHTCVCMHTHMCMYIYIYIYIHTHTHTYTHTCTTHTHTHVYLHI